MTLTVSGAQFKAFYQDPDFWPEDGGDTYHDDVLFLIDGHEAADMDADKLADTASVTIVYGGVVEGKGAGMGLDDYLKKWLSAQSSVLLSIEVPKDKLQEVLATLESAGVTIKA